MLSIYNIFPSNTQFSHNSFNSAPVDLLNWAKNCEAREKYTNDSKIYVKYINNVVGTINNSVLISWYYLFGQNKAIKKMKNKERKTFDSYMLCIGYNEGDIQLGLTGGVLNNESHLDCVQRELYEETMLCCNQNDIVKIYQKNETSFYSLSIEKCFIKEFDENNVYEKSNEKVTKRSLLYLHGPYDIMKKFVNNMKVMYSSECITHYTLLPIQIAKEITQHLANRQITKLKYESFIYNL